MSFLVNIYFGFIVCVHELAHLSSIRFFVTPKSSNKEAVYIKQQHKTYFYQNEKNNNSNQIALLLNLNGYLPLPILAIFLLHFPVLMATKHRCFIAEITQILLKNTTIINTDNANIKYLLMAMNIFGSIFFSYFLICLQSFFFLLRPL